MSMTENPTALPPGGRVLVIGMTLPNQDQIRFGTRVESANHWELSGGSRRFADVALILHPLNMRSDSVDRIRTWAKQNDVPSINPVTRELLSSVLRNVLGESETRSLARPPVVQKAVAKASARAAAPPPVMAPPSPMSQPTLPAVVAIDGQVVDPPEELGYLLLDPARVKPLPDQPRTYFSRRLMKELTLSIRRKGQLTPVQVRRVQDDPDFDYQLVEGERRLRVVRAEGLLLKATIVEVASVLDHLEQSFAANFARATHTPMETARFVARMLTYPKYSSLTRTSAFEEIGALAGKTGQWAYTFHRLLELPSDLQEMLEPFGEDEKPRLSTALGVFLCSVPDKGIQSEVCTACVQGGLSVIAARALARKLAHAKGLSVGTRKKRPIDGLRLVRRRLTNAREGFEDILSRPGQDIASFFQNQPSEVPKEVVEEIDTLIAHLKNLRGQIEKVSTDRVH